VADGGRDGHRRHLLLLPHEEPRRLGRRRDDGDARRRACRPPSPGTAARRGPGVLPRRGGTQQPAGLNASRGPARQAAVPRRLERAAAAARRTIHERTLRHPGCAAAKSGPRERAHLPPIHDSGRAPGPAAGASEDPRDRPKDLLPARAPPAALLRAPGIRARPPAGRGRDGCSDLLPIYPSQRVPAGRGVGDCGFTGDAHDDRSGTHREGQEPKALFGVVGLGYVGPPW
jgi:hypothetical protein